MTAPRKLEKSIRPALPLALDVRFLTVLSSLNSKVVLVPEYCPLLVECVLEIGPFFKNTVFTLKPLDEIDFHQNNLNYCIRDVILYAV